MAASPRTASQPPRPLRCCPTPCSPALGLRRVAKVPVVASCAVRCARRPARPSTSAAPGALHGKTEGRNTRSRGERQRGGGLEVPGGGGAQRGEDAGAAPGLAAPPVPSRLSSSPRLSRRTAGRRHLSSAPILLHRTACRCHLSSAARPGAGHLLLWPSPSLAISSSGHLLFWPSPPLAISSAGHLHSAASPPPPHGLLPLGAAHPLTRQRQASLWPHLFSSTAARPAAVHVATHSQGSDRLLTAWLQVTKAAASSTPCAQKATATYLVTWLLTALLLPSQTCHLRALRRLSFGLGFRV